MGCLKLEILEKYDNLKITFRAKNSVFLGDLDYYPFGMQMPGRSFNSSSYRWGFGGVHEKDDEIRGIPGADYDFGGYGYDALTCRRKSVDPLFKEYPYISPYAFGGNSPILIIDRDGEKLIISGSKKEQRQLLRQVQKLTNDKLIIDKVGNVTVKHFGNKNPSENLEFGSKLINDIINDENTGTLMSVDKFRKDYGTLDDKYKNWEGNVTFVYGDTPDEAYNGVGVDANTVFDKFSNGSDIMNADGTYGRPKKIGLGHELIHMKNLLLGKVGNPEKDQLTKYKDPDWNYDENPMIDDEEINVRKEENILRKEQHIKQRAEIEEVSGYDK